jgi:hypothetical protein
VRNPNQQPRSRTIQRLMYAPPRPLRGLYGRLRHIPVVHRVRDALGRSNAKRTERKAMDPDLRRRLTEEFAPQVADLGALIGRDLSAWSRV